MDVADSELRADVKWPSARDRLRNEFTDHQICCLFWAYQVLIEESELTGTVRQLVNDTLTQGTGTKRLPKKQLKAVSDRLHKLYKEPTWSQKFQVHFRLSHLSINQQRWGWQAPRAHRPTQMEQTRREKQHAYDVMVALRKFHPAPQVRDRLKREKLATEQQQEVERQKANQGSRVKHNALMDSDDTSESMLGSMFG